MKRASLVPTLVFGLCVSAQAALYQIPFTSGFVNGQDVPDGNLSGWSDTRAVSVGLVNPQITEVSVKLNLSSGYNGDLYAYLSYNGALVVLLNRVGVGAAHAGNSGGFGYGDAGMNLTLQDNGASGDLHWYGGGGAPTGTYAPDGRYLSPLSSAASFDANGTVTFNAAFFGKNPNGDWTLFVADVSGGGGTSHILSWQLDLNVVPEPVNAALVVFGICGVGVQIGRWLCARRRLSRTRRE